MSRMSGRRFSGGTLIAVVAACGCFSGETSDLEGKKCTTDADCLGYLCMDTQVGMVSEKQCREPGRVTAVAVGIYNTCVVVDGKARCWGGNDGCQLGYGELCGKCAGAADCQLCDIWTDTTTGNVTTGDVADPNYGEIDFGALEGKVIGVAVGAPVNGGYSPHACGVLEGGEVICWGIGEYQTGNTGWLGRGDTMDVADLRCGEVVGLSRTAASVSVSELYSCAILAGGSAACWGNGARPLGGEAVDGIVGLSLPLSVQSLATGVEHACAILGDGAAWCWGANVYGQLGTGNEMPANKPIQVTSSVAPSMPSFSSVGAGKAHSCALAPKEGEIYCWGLNDSGQLGADVMQTCGEMVGCSQSPVQVDLDGAKAAHLAVGLDHACAVLSDNSIRCWGDNMLGQLGPTVSMSRSSQPQKVDLSVQEGVVQLVSGGNHTCAVTESRALYCWGDNSKGQLGHSNPSEKGVYRVPIRRRLD